MMQEERPLEVTIFWRRFFAFLIDFALMAALLILLMLPIFMTSQQGPNGTFPTLIVAIVWLGLVFAYDIVSTKLMGGTLGKKALKITVVDLGQNPLSWGRSAARSFSRAFHMMTFNFIARLLLEDKIIEKITLAQDPLQLASHGLRSLVLTVLLLWILSVIILYSGYYLFFFTQNRQTLHDLMAGTLVTRKR
jgi:uncharacterized RDD family membrane protein YckC